MHFTLSIRANCSTQDAWKSADIMRCARSGLSYLEPKGLPAELKELSWTESATLGYKHTIWIQRILPANRDRALGYKMKQPQIVNTLFTPKTKRRKMKQPLILNTLITPKTKRRKRVHAVIQIIQVIMTTANIEWLNLTFKRRRRLTETFCAVFWW